MHFPFFWAERPNFALGNYPSSTLNLIQEVMTPAHLWAVCATQTWPVESGNLLASAIGFKMGM